MNLPKMIESFGFPVTLLLTKDRVFFSERITGNLWEVVGANFRLVKSFPVTKATGHHETGLLGITADPDFEKNDFLYCYYSYGENLNVTKNAVAKIKADGTETKVIIDNIPGGPIHNGGILAFGPDGCLYIGIGIDNPVMEKSQDLNFLGGKILRLNPDGTIPEDNPYPGSPVFSYGHRNIFGLAFHPVSGELYITEEGSEVNDEINVIEKGGNYGWPKVTGITNEEFINPIITYTPTITPTQCCFFNNNLYFGSFNEGTVHKLTFAETDFRKVVKDEVVYNGRPFGVIGVFVDPEGQFYITTPNKILKIESSITN